MRECSFVVVVSVFRDKLFESSAWNFIEALRGQYLELLAHQLSSLLLMWVDWIWHARHVTLIRNKSEF